MGVVTRDSGQAQTERIAEQALRPQAGLNFASFALQWASCSRR